MENIRRMLVKYAADAGISVSAHQAEQFQAYLELLTEWNQKMNLTAITEPREIVVKHFLDSILLLNAYGIPRGARVIDIGTGAGFPGLPLKIMRDDLSLTLLDSLNKRLIFLKDVCEKLEISAGLIHARAEEAGRKKEMRGSYDLVAARAVAPLNILCEYCLPLVKTGGVFAAMKGPGGPEELSAAQNALSLLGADAGNIRSFSLPDGSARTILLMKKTAPTSDKYPRASAKIAKSPLERI